MFISLFLAVISRIIRISARVLFDKFIFIVEYTKGLIEFFIFYIFIYICRNAKENKIINFFDSISFEIYLVHYMYIVEPLRIMGLTDSFIVNTVITLTITILTSIVLKKVCKNFYLLIEGIKINRNISKPSSLYIILLYLYN